MGRKKNKKITVKRKTVIKLDKEFNCPYCNNTKTVGVKMNYGSMLGELQCRICGAADVARISKLDEAVDVYSNWIDRCYDANKAENAEVNKPDQSSDDYSNSDIEREEFKRIKRTKTQKNVSSLDKENADDLAEKYISYYRDEAQNEADEEEEDVSGLFRD